MITLYYLLEYAESYFERKGVIQKIIFWSVISLIVVSVFMWCMCGVIDDLVARWV
nr:MAG TPA: hypothetical protein [Caudoviricetes sp.]